jgi:hypothetical protein
MGHEKPRSFLTSENQEKENAKSAINRKTRVYKVIEVGMFTHKKQVIEIFPDHSCFEL